MNTRSRYILAWVLGIGVSVLAWYGISMSHRIFTHFGIGALVAPIVAGILGGAVVSIFAPKNKISMSAAVGFVVVSPIFYLLLHKGFNHFGRNPFIWYWPIYVIPSFIIGGIMGRNIWRHA
jgi:hypothetical protein